MPVLSLHNTYSIPTGSASYTLGLSGAPGGASCGIAGIGGVTSYTYPGGIVSGGGGISSSGVLGATSGGHTSDALSRLLGTTGGNIGAGMSMSGGANNLTGPYNTSKSSYSTYTNPLLTTGGLNMKLKSYDEMDLMNRYGGGGGRAASPNSPILPGGSWCEGMESYVAGLECVNPTFMHTRLGELDSKNYFFCFVFIRIKRPFTYGGALLFFYQSFTFC